MFGTEPDELTDKRWAELASEAFLVEKLRARLIAQEVSKLFKTDEA